MPTTLEPSSCSAAASTPPPQPPSHTATATPYTPSPSTTEFTSEAAHRLPRVPDGHPRANLHGHSYRITLHVTGPVGPATGWVIDFADLTAAFQRLREQLDHRCLNDVDGLANPINERLAAWIWRRLEPLLAGLYQITVRETATSGCTYRGAPLQR